MTTVGARIREGRKSLKLTQSQLGTAVGVTDQSISDWEKDKALPINFIVPLATALKVTTDYLLTGNTKKQLTLDDVLNPAFKTSEAPRMHELPVANKIAANHQATFAECKETQQVDVKYDRTNHYCLLVKGRSMHPTVMEGDVVIVRRTYMQLDAFDPMRGPANKDAWMRLNKKVVCALVDDEDPELKRLYVQEARKKDTGFIMYLRGDNPQSRMITIEKETSLKIVGIVQQIMRDPNNYE